MPLCSCLPSLSPKSACPALTLWAKLVSGKFVFDTPTRSAIMIDIVILNSFAATVRRKLFSSKEKQIWAIKEKEIKAKKNNRKRPSSIQRKDEN